MQKLMLFLFVLNFGNTLDKCAPVYEYFHEKFGCRLCPPCIKGTGIDLKQKINNQKTCYSCSPCKNGSFQARLHVFDECQPCHKCEHSKILRNCTSEENSLCGDCLPRYEYKNINGYSICWPIPNKKNSATDYLHKKITTICISVFLWYIMTF